MNPLVPEAAAAAPERPPDPRDQYTWFTKFWAVWFGSMLLVEGLAFYLDRKNKDRKKRTLSSNTRRATGWDSITGQPIDVPYGKVRRAAFVMFMAWFGEHIRRNGGNQELKV